MPLVPLAAIRILAQSAGYPASKPHLIERLRRENATRVLGKAARGQRGFLYEVESLPEPLRKALGEAGADDRATAPDNTLSRFAAAPAGIRAIATERNVMMISVRALIAEGKSSAAFAAVATEFGVSTATVRRQWATVSVLPEAEWLAALMPAYKPRAADPVHPEILRYFFGDYGRVEQPNLQAVWERTIKAAAKNGWGRVPHAKTLKRHWDRLSVDVRTLWRDGEHKLGERLPHAERDRSGMLPLDGFNVDSRTWDIFVRARTHKSPWHSVCFLIHGFQQEAVDESRPVLADGCAVCADRAASADRHTWQTAGR